MAGKPRTNPVTDDQIVAMYEKERSAYRTAEFLGIGDTTVYRVLVKRGINRTGLKDYRKKITRFRGREKTILEWYESGATLDVIRKKLGGASDYSIKHAIRRAGGTLRINPAPTIKRGELETILSLHEQGMSQLQISLKIERSQGFVSRTLRRAGVFSSQKSGAEHSAWTGGRFTTAGGYVRVWVRDDDPMASMRNNSGHVLEHRLVMARALHRPLTKFETVHHINGNTADNRPENLQLRKGRHGKGVVLRCLDCGSENIGPGTLKEAHA